MNETDGLGAGDGEGPGDALPLPFTGRSERASYDRLASWIERRLLSRVRRSYESTILRDASTVPSSSTSLAGHSSTAACPPPTQLLTWSSIPSCAILIVNGAFLAVLSY